jgi:hypothetical protein
MATYYSYRETGMSVDCTSKETKLIKFCRYGVKIVYNQSL